MACCTQKHGMGKHWKPTKVNLIDPVWRGIFVTCNRGREAQCAREIRDWFEQTAEQLFPDAESDSEEKKASAGDGDAGAAAAGEPDIEAAIKAEVEPLKTSRKRIVVHDKLGVECLLFVQTRHPVDPVALALRVCEECAQKQRHAKYIQKLSPVQQFVKFEHLERLAPVLQAGLGAQTSFAIRPSLRLCKETRDEVIPAVARLIGSEHKVDLKNYDELVVIEGFKTLLGASVLKLDAQKMKALHQLNLLQITQHGAAPA